MRRGPEDLLDEVPHQSRIERNLTVAAHPLEDLLDVRQRGILRQHLELHAAEERIVHEVARPEVRGKDDEHHERQHESSDRC
jgi:hypothetical protein